MKPAKVVEPYVWGFIGTGVAAILMIAALFSGMTLSTPSPLAGGFFTGWLAGHGWNWAGRVTARSRAR